MTVLRVHLLGDFRMAYCDMSWVNFESQRAQELFAYLLLHRQRPHPRETLAELLWTESSSAQSKRCLRQTLWQLQIALSRRGFPTDERLFKANSYSVWVNPDVTLWLDTELFEQAYREAHTQLGATYAAATAERVRQALELYRGDLLEGWYQDWCLCARERFQLMYLDLLDRMMEYCESHGEYDDGLRFGECSLHVDRAHERTYYRMMRLYYHAGNRALALRQYERCAVVLREELKVAPAHQTRALYEQLCADRVDDAQLLPHPILPTSSDTLGEVLARLQQIARSLADMQSQVHCEIRSVQAALLSPKDGLHR